MVYSKPLGGKSRIVKLVREMKKKIGSFTWAVLYNTCIRWEYFDFWEQVPVLMYIAQEQE